MSSEIHIPGYEILDELGAGGMAKVYLGIQTSLDRKVAIKILHAALSAQSDEFKQRFFHEGKVLARVNHPNIVSIYDIGEANGLLYMAMEYVPGGTLTDRLKVEQLTVDECIQVCGQVGLALHTTHLEHIVHRDLKPSNVLMRDGVKPMLTDFGIARETDTDVGLTQTGHIVGTLQYMSPEQIRGLPVDHRSDIYSLGLLFYRLLTGRLPFVASSHYDLSRMQCEDPPPPLPPELAEFQPLMDVILAKDPNDRFQTTLDFCKALQSLNVTNEDYRTELTQQTRIYDSSRMPFQQSYGTGGYSGPHSGRHSGRHTGPHSAEVSARTSGAYTAAPTVYQPRGQAAGQVPAQRPWLKPVLAFGLPLVALISAVVLYFALWYTPASGLNEDEQRRMDNFLQRVASHYDNLDIDEPPEDNAVYYLQRALNLAPDYPPALEWARRIAEYYAVDAEMALEAGNVENAQAIIAKGKAIDPEYKLLADLDQQVSEFLAEQRRQADIEEALGLAANYQAQERLIDPPDANAFDAYRKALDLDPVNQAALQGLAAIEQALVEDLRALVDAGNLEQAGVRLPQIEARFPDSTAVARIQDEIGEQLRLAAEQQEIREQLAAAERQMTEGKLIEPEYDNALESYRAVLNLRPENEAALRGLEAIAGAFVASAREALAASDFQRAVELADNGLLASPEHGELTQVRGEALGQLGAREREIQDLLQTAQSLVMAGQFLPPGDNALETFQRVEAMDPGNAQAARGINLLPRNILDEIEQLKIRTFFDEAQALARAAEQAYPGDQRFTEARAELNDLVAEEQRRERLEEMLQRSAALIATRPMTLDVIDQSAAALEKLRSEFPGDVNATSQLNSLISAISEEARTVSRGGNEESGLLLLERGLTHFSGNPTLTGVRQGLVRQREERIAAEQARIAAMTGQLAIDAIPWGEVVAIVNGDGEALDLPADATTPLVIPLLEGRYRVSVRDEPGQDPVELDVAVVAQQVATTTARFESMTADEYFERSGW